MTTKEIKQLFSELKDDSVVERRSVGGRPMDAWERVVKPTWDFSYSEYRIVKPKKLRPWNMEELQRNIGVVVCEKSTTSRFMIMGAKDRYAYLPSEGWVSTVILLDNYLTNGGSPCGVME